MITHLNGRLVEKNPMNVVIECSGVGYNVLISLHSFSQIGQEESLRFFTRHIVREDAQLLYGFVTKDERAVFDLLISVSGIGPNTAMIMLSSLSPEEVASAILAEDVKVIQSVKGIGLKTAQRVIIDLKDKILKLNLGTENVIVQNNTMRFDALNALLSLGFDKKAAEKAIDKVAQPDDTVEKIIKEALRIL